MIEGFVSGENLSTLNDLWSALCHQGTIYPASLAGAPWLVHLVEAGEITDQARKLDAIYLAGGIALESFRQVLPQVPPAIFVQFSLCLRRLPALLIDQIRAGTTREEAQTILGMVAVLKGQTKLGFNLYDDPGEMECPSCDAAFPRFYDFDESYSHVSDEPEKR